MTSTNFINECKNRANANRLGKIIVDGIDTPITNSNNLQSFEIDSGCYVDGNIIGSVYAKCLKANFIADQNNLTDKSIQAQIGVKYADLSTEYINMGKYTIERPNNEITAQYSQITAYSSLYTKLDDKYVCNIDYSSDDKTVSDLYIDVCNQLGLIPKTTTFINSTIHIIDNPFTNGEKNRTVLQTICKIACSFVDIDTDTNKIDLCWLSESTTPDYTFKKNDYSSVEGGQVICGPINCLIIKNSQIDDENVTIKDDESITKNGEHSITISEDYILYNAELRQQAITSIWNRVKGMKYVDCKLTTYYGKPFLKLGDYIRIYTSETEYFDTYVLKHNFAYDGAFTSVIESPALTEQEIKTKQDISLGELLSKTQINVNKQLKKITADVSAIDSTLNSITTTNKTVSNKNSLYIENALEENALEFRVKGKSEQETSSPSPDYPSEIKSVNGVENFFDISTERTGYHIDDTGSIYKNAVWTISQPIKIKSNSNIILQANSNLGQLLIVEYSSNNLTKANFVKKSQTATGSSDVITLKTQATTKYVVIGYRNDKELTDIMLSYGTSKKTYLSYGSNFLIEKVTGKNILNTTKMLTTQTLNSVTCTYDKETQIITLNGTCTYDNTLFSFPKIETELSGVYTLTCFHIGGTITNTKSTTKIQLLNNKTWYGINTDLKNSSSSKTGSLKINANFNNIRIDKDVVLNNYKIKVQLEQNTEPTEYEPYKGQEILINLKGNELCSTKDLSVRDELVVTENETYIDKKIGKIILDGSDDENYYYVENNSVNNFSQFNYATRIENIDFSDNGSKVLCTHLNYYVNAHNNNKNQSGIRLYANNPAFVFSIPETVAKTVDEFKAYLSKNPFEIYYALATPEKIELDKVDIPLFENINNLTLLEDLETDTNVKYLLKTPISEDYITKHEANAKFEITQNSITQLVNDTETNLNLVNQKYAETKLASDGLSISVADIQKNVNSQQEDISNINSNINKTNSELNSLKNNINNTNEVVTKMNYNFDTKELNINKETDPINTGISNKGMIVRNYTTIKTVANDKGLGTDDLIVTNTAQIGYLKFMKSTDESGNLVTDIHHLVSNIQQVSDLVGD